MKATSFIALAWRSGSNPMPRLRADMAQRPDAPGTAAERDGYHYDSYDVYYKTPSQARQAEPAMA